MRGQKLNFAPDFSYHKGVFRDPRFAFLDANFRTRRFFDNLSTGKNLVGYSICPYCLLGNTPLFVS